MKKNALSLIYLCLIYLIGFVTTVSAQMNVKLIGQLKPVSASFSDIWGYTDGNGREYAIMGAYEGTYIIDLGNPADPQVVSFIAGPHSIWRDMKVYNKYAYVVTENGGSGQGLQIIDLSNLPVSASLVNTVSTYFTTAHNIFIENGFALVVGADTGGGMYILDLSDPVNPVETAYYSGSGYIHDVYAWGDSVIVATGDNYALVDISDKTNPVKVSESANLPGYSHSGWMTEDKRYFFGTDEFNKRDLTIFDLQDRSNWDIKVNSWQLPENTIIHNIFIKGNYAHISYYESGYVVLDITDPLNPYLIGQYDTYPTDNPDYNGVWGCFPYFNSGLTIVSDIDNGLYVLKFTPGDTFPIIKDIKYEQYILNTDSVQVTAKVTDNNNVAKVNLFYRTNIEGQTSSWKMLGETVGAADVFTFTMPGQPAKAVVEFYFAASDDSGHVVTSPKGGDGINPVGSIPPTDLYSYQIVITGPPVILTLLPDIIDTTVVRGDGIRFSADAMDTTGLELAYKWYSNGSFKSAAKRYAHGTGFGAVPRTDTVKLIVSNGFIPFERIWYVHVENTVSVDENINNITYNLRQNYPNPFNPSTIISFSIPHEANVRLTIINSLGQQVEELLNQNLRAGTHNLNFTAENLPSGTYFYKLEAGSFVKIRKMILLK